MLWDGTYGFSSLSEKTCLQMPLRSQFFLLSYLKTLSVGLVRVRARDLPLSRELTRRWLERKLILSTATSTQIPNHDTNKKRCEINKQHNKQSYLRPGSDAELFVGRFSLKPTQTIYTLFRPAQLIQTPIIIPFPFHLFLLNSKGCKISYNNLRIRFGTWKVRLLIQSHSNVAPKSEFPVGLARKTKFQIEIGVPNRFRRRTFQYN